MKRANAVCGINQAKQKLLTSGPSSNLFKFSVHEPPSLINFKNTLALSSSFNGEDIADSYGT
jgi:hypothetical protein